MRLLRAAPMWVLVLAACGGAAVDGAGDHVRLRVLVQPFMAHAPLLIADAAGFLAEQGFDVEFVRLPDMSVAIPMLIDGSLDVLSGAPTPAILNAMARGVPIRAVADKGWLRPDGCSNMGLVIRQALLDGSASGPPAVRRVSIEKYPQMVYLGERALAAAGIRPDQVEMINVPHVPELEALARGTVDAAWVGEPWLTLSLERGVAQWIRAEDVMPGGQFSFVYFGPTLLNGDPDIGRRFLIAYLKAVRRFEEGKTAENLELLARLTGNDPDMIRRMCWPVFRTDGEVDLGLVIDFAHWAQERNLIDRPITERGFWDPQFLRAALRTLELSDDGTGK